MGKLIGRVKERKQVLDEDKTGESGEKQKRWLYVREKAHPLLSEWERKCWSNSNQALYNVQNLYIEARFFNLLETLFSFFFFFFYFTREFWLSILKPKNKFRDQISKKDDGLSKILL